MVDIFEIGNDKPIDADFYILRKLALIIDFEQVNKQFRHNFSL